VCPTPGHRQPTGLGDPEQQAAASTEDIIRAFRNGETGTNVKRHLDRKIAKIREFLGFADISGPSQIALAACQDWLASLLGSGKAPKTVANMRGDLGRFCGFLVERDLLDSNPVRRIKPPKIDESQPLVYLTREELDEAVSAAERLELQPVLIAAHAGVRLGSLMAMRRGDIRQDRRGPLWS
jgi:site-specific recombinase XerD